MIYWYSSYRFLSYLSLHQHNFNYHSYLFLPLPFQLAITSFPCSFSSTHIFPFLPIHLLTSPLPQISFLSQQIMQASLYRFKSSIVNSAHTATNAIMNALQHTAVDEDELDFNENMFPCCEENEVNSPGKINLTNFNHLEVFLMQFLFTFFDLLYHTKLFRLMIQFIYFHLLYSFCSLPLYHPPSLPPSFTS